jgi:uncharacterized protein YjbI with pentapeptide repeats
MFVALFCVTLVCMSLHLVNSFSLPRWMKVKDLKLTAAKALVTSALVIAPCYSFSETLAVSGGGKDFATKDLKDTDFTGKSEIGKDFTQCDAAGVSFKNAVLSGSRFYRSNLKETDFSVETIIFV